MTIYFTSDQHFGQRNMLKHLPRRNQLFKNDVDLMDQIIIENFNHVVKPTDDVYLLGDFFNGSDKIKFMQYVNALNGKLHFIKGNHDDRNVFNLLKRKHYDTNEVGMSLKLNHHRLMLTHYGLLSQGYPASNKIECWSIHGHIHSSQYQMLNQINISVDSPLAVNKPFGEPISQTELLTIIKNRKAMIETLGETETKQNLKLYL